MELTPGTIWAVIAAILGGLSLILGTTKMITDAYKQVKAPGIRQDERISALETDMKQVKKDIDAGFRKIDDQSNATRISQEALLALLDHGISGNNNEQMQAAKDKLQEYLINH